MAKRLSFIGLLCLFISTASCAFFPGHIEPGGWSSEASLAALGLSEDVELAPVFAADVTQYSAVVPHAIDAVSILATPAHELATLTIDDAPVQAGLPSTPIALVAGAEVSVPVVVTAEDTMAIETYTISLSRQAPSDDASLSSLELSSDLALAPVFRSYLLEYRAQAAYDIAELRVTATATHQRAAVRVSGVFVDSGSTSVAISLTAGNHTEIKIVVTAPDGATERTYVVDVKRERAPRTDASLASLTVSTGILTPSFASGTFVYDVALPFAAEALSVTAGATDEAATLTVAGEGLSSGVESLPLALTAGQTTSFSIEVTAEDQATTQIYTVNVTRAAPSTDATLASLSLSVDALTPVFDSATLSYGAPVDYTVTSVTVTAVTNDGAANLTVEGIEANSGIETSPIALTAAETTSIEVVVTAEDGTTTVTYTIGVSRAAASSDATLLELTVSSGTLIPTFTTNGLAYDVSVSSSTASVTVTATTPNSGATLTIAGSQASSGVPSAAVSLTEGASNIIDIVVTAQDSTTVITYSVDVFRASADLSALALGGGATLSPTFSSSVVAYAASVANSVATVTVTPTASDAGATIQVAGVDVTSGQPSANIDLTAGATTQITIEVTASDTATVKSYTIDVTRAGWVFLGTQGLDNPAVIETTGVQLMFNGDVPFVGFKHTTGVQGLAAVTFNGNGWVDVGANPFTTNGFYARFTLDGAMPYAAYQDPDATDFASAMAFADPSWAPVGTPGFSATSSYDTSIAVIAGVPYLAYRHWIPTDYFVRVETYSAGAWQPLGATDFPTLDPSHAKLVAYGADLFLVYVDKSTTNLTVMVYSGSSWTTLGGVGFADIACGFVSIACVDIRVDDGQPFVAFKDGSVSAPTGRTSVMAYSGTWSLVGAAGFSDNEVMELSLAVRNGVPSVAYRDLTTGRAVARGWDSVSSWVDLGGSYLSPAGGYYPSIGFSASGVLHVAFEDKEVGSKPSVVYLVE